MYDCQVVKKKDGACRSYTTRSVLQTIGDPGYDEVGHSSEADPEGLEADEKHSSPLISTDQTKKETALAAYCFNSYLWARFLVFEISVN